MAIRSLKEILTLVSGRFFQVVCQIITIRIATTLMTPENMGTVNQMMSVPSLLEMGLIIPVGLYLGIGFLEWFESGILAEYLKKFIKYGLLISVVAAFFTGIVQSKYLIVHGITPIWFSLLVGLGLFSNSMNTAATSGLNMLGFRNQFILFNNLQVWLGLGFATLFFLLFSDPAIWLFGQYIGAAISSVSMIVLLVYLKTTKHSSTRQMGSTMAFDFPEVIRFAWPQVFTLLFWWVQSQSYRFLLEKIWGLEQVGLFAVGYSLCAAPIAAAEALFNQFYTPTFYRNFKGQNIDGRARAWSEYANAYIPAIIMVGGFLTAAGPLLSKILLDKKFLAVGQFLVWPAMIETIRAIGSTVHFMGVAKADMRVMLIPAGVGAILAPIGVYFLAGTSPFHGTGLALLISGAGSLLSGVIFAFRGMPVIWPIRRIIASVIFCIPMLIGFKILVSRMPEISLLSNIIVLLLGTLYLLIAEYCLARKWLPDVWNFGKESFK